MRDSEDNWNINDLDEREIGGQARDELFFSSTGAFVLTMVGTFSIMLSVLLFNWGVDLAGPGFFLLLGIGLIGWSIMVFHGNSKK